MTTVKPSGADLDALQAAAKLLKKANALFSIAKKDSEAAKAKILEWLKSERKIDIEALPIGEMVLLDSVCLIERGKQNKFDEGSFLLNEPDLHTKYKKDFPTTKYRALV